MAPFELVLHLSFPAEMPIAGAIERALRRAFPALESVVLHHRAGGEGA